MKLGERIQFLRLKSDMTQKELGSLINVSVVSIGGWENGTRKPSADAIIALSDVFNVTADYLLGITSKPEDNFPLLDRNEKSLLSNYRLLDKYGKKAVEIICSAELSRVKAQENLCSEALTVSAKHSARYIPRYTTPSAAGASVPLDGDDFEMILADSSVPTDAE